MKKLKITVKVRKVDPALVDPMEVAEDVISSYEDDMRAHNALFDVAGLVSAEWID